MITWHTQVTVTGTRQVRELARAAAFMDGDKISEFVARTVRDAMDSVWKLEEVRPLGDPSQLDLMLDVAVSVRQYP